MSWDTDSSTERGLRGRSLGLVRGPLRMCENAAMFIAVASIFLIAILLFADTIARYFFSTSLSGVSNFAAEYLIVMMVYLGFAFTWRKGQHARVSLFKFDRWPQMLTFSRYFSSSVTVAVFVLVIYANWQAMGSAYVRGTVSAGNIPYPLWPAYLMVCLGALLLVLTACFRPDPGNSAVQGESEDDERERPL